MALSRGDTILLLHNPKCSKSRAAKALLEEKGAAFEVRTYLDAPLDRAELEELATLLGRAPGEWVRSGQTEYAEAGLDAASGADALLDAMASRPILVERPIAIRGDKAVVGRPPENVLELL
jgi:arsenate reductase